jgi:hypothetical protein
MSRFPGCWRQRRWFGVGESGRGTDQAADGGGRSECCEQASFAIDGFTQICRRCADRNANLANFRQVSRNRKVLGKGGRSRPVRSNPRAHIFEFPM